MLIFRNFYSIISFLCFFTLAIQVTAAPAKSPADKNDSAFLKESIHETDRKVEQTIDAILSQPAFSVRVESNFERYFAAPVRNWLKSLQPFQQERASTILKEARPEMQNLRDAIRDKKSEMAELSFDRNTVPETLPRLGMELKELRISLRNKLEAMCNRLFFEAGVNPGSLRSAGFCFVPRASGNFL